ncbi:MAG: hypothetical protein AABZ57_01910 [Candidatus Margulisiibacteriota bacterium]
MDIGRNNVRFGWIWLLFFVILGFYLETRVADPTWKGMQKELWAAAHVHGNLLSVINIIYGLTIDGINLDTRLKRTGSWFLILGTILFASGLFLMPFLMALGILVMIGAVAIIIALSIMACGQLFLKS